MTKGSPDAFVREEMRQAVDTLAQLTKKEPPAHPLGQLNPKPLAAAKGLFFYHTKKVGLGIGVKWGGGFLILRTNDLAESPATWSSPVFYKVKEGSFGLTAGGGTMHSIIMLGTYGAVEALKTGKAVIGTDFSLAVLEGETDGEESVVGKDAVSATTTNGLLADFSLSGGAITVDKERNEALYGPGATASTVLEGSTAHAALPEADVLYGALNTVIGNAEKDPRKFSGFAKHWSPQKFLNPLPVDAAYAEPEPHQAVGSAAPPPANIHVTATSAV